METITSVNPQLPVLTPEAAHLVTDKPACPHCNKRGELSGHCNKCGSICSSKCEAPCPKLRGV